MVCKAGQQDDTSRLIGHCFFEDLQFPRVATRWRPFTGDSPTEQLFPLNLFLVVLTNA